ncbi:MAG: MFS transporter [Spirochaetes bacterium]|nr:MFS transporter [Spirochaetota bacterium]
MEKAKRASIWLLPVILLSYFVVGFPDGSFTVSWLGIAYDIPGMTTAHTGWILVGYSVTYTLAGVILSWVNRFLKLQTIYFWGLIIMGLGFIGLALSPNFAAVVAFISLYGFGTGAMASSMNSYMAKHFTARHNNWMHFFWGAGAAISPIIMGQSMLAHSWRTGYFVITAVLGLVAVMLFISMYKKVWIDDAAATLEADAVKKSKKFLTKKWHQNVQVLTFFFLGGTDYTLVFFTGAALIARGYYNVTIFSAVYYLFMTLGRMVTGWVARWLKEVSIIRISVLVSVTGIGVLYFTSSVIGMAVVGFGLGPLLPTLVSDTSNCFKPNILPKIVGYELAAFGAGIAVLFFITSQILHFISYEALFYLGLSFIVLVFVCNEVLEKAHSKVS